METKNIRGVGRYRPGTMPHLADVVILFMPRKAAKVLRLNVD